MYLGLDISLTATGFCLIDDDYSIIESCTLKFEQTDIERLYLLDKKFQTLIQNRNILLACIEGYAYQDTGRIAEIGELNGILKLDLFKEGIKYITVAPLQLKKYICGTGKDIKKELIILDIFKNFGVEIRDNNIADAYGLSRIARDYYYIQGLKRDVALKAYQEDVINKMKKSQGEINAAKLL